MAASQTPVLALPGVSVESWRRNEELIDSLPYIDAMPPDVKKQVDGLIDEEMRKSTKKTADYLREMPPVPPPRLENHPVLKAEYDRIKRKEPMAALDTSRYRLDQPSQAKRQDPAAWKASVDNAHSQLEHQYLRILNLELMLKYGDKAWRAQVISDEGVLKQIEAELADTRRRITQLNMERKLQQTAAGNELRKAEEEYFDLVRKNFAIEEACRALEDQAHTLREQLGGQQQGQGQGGQEQGGQQPAGGAPPAEQQAMEVENGHAG